MMVQTFNPPVPPSPGTADKPEVKLRKSDFGDGYSQATRDGLNHIRRVLSLNWETLTPEQANAVTVFFAEHGGDTPFLYTPSDETTPLAVTCDDWSDRRGQAGFRSVSATLRQFFGALS